MREVAELPRPVREIENIFIPLADGPAAGGEDVAPRGRRVPIPVPVVIEYMPYRKRDHFRPRDSRIHHYLAGHGYACLRVDVRGSGDSDGLLRGEWEPGELDDGVEMIEWAAGQPWSTGAVGMIGKSWSGFTCLTLGRLRPRAAQGHHPRLLRRRPLPSVAALGPGAPSSSSSSGGRTRWCCSIPARRTRPSWAKPGARCGRNVSTNNAPWIDHLARPPASRRLLATRLDLRGLGRHPLPCLRRRRLGRLPLALRPAPARESRRTLLGTRRALGSPLSARGDAGTGGRLPPGVRALLRPVPEGRAERLR